MRDAARPASGCAARLATALAIALACLSALPAAVRAGQAEPAVADPMLEDRVNQLAAELRCLVCQNQSLADSHADLAVDLKNQVREQLRAGRSAQQVIDYMTERYGDFVLYRPPVKPTTWLLWGGPALMLFAGAVLMWRTLGARRGASGVAPSADELQRAAALLGAMPPGDAAPDPGAGASAAPAGRDA